MCQTTKSCQSHATQSQSSSSRQQSRSSSSSSSSRIDSYTLIMALTALLPLTHARHLHDQLAIAYDTDSSSSLASSSEDNDGSLPAWHANPFHGLEQSFGESRDYAESDSNDSDSESESESSYEQITQAAIQAAMRELRRQRIRHRRSHTLKFFIRAQHEAAAATAATAAAAAPAEWENPCGGVYQPNSGSAAESDSSSQGRVVKRKFLIELRNNTFREYNFIRSNANINYSSTLPWEHEYKFLPNATRPTNAIKLKTWYRHIQTFAGSFAHLGKAHYKYRKEHQLRLDESTHELHELLVSARRVLCEIETTINSSYPNSHGAKLTQVSKQTMKERLKFHTPADGSEESNLNDLMISKQLYIQYLNNMWRTLGRALRKQHRNSMERRHHHVGVSASASGSATGSGSAGSANSLQNFSLESSEAASVGGRSRCGNYRNSGEC